MSFIEGNTVDQVASAPVTLEDLMVQWPPVNLTGRVIIPRANHYGAPEGGFATVYHGDMIGFPVAVKVLKKHRMQEESFRRRLYREIKVWAALHHPNIINLIGYSYDFGEYAAMISPWCAKGNASKYLSSDRVFSIPERYRLIQDVGEGLKYLHYLKVVHGDLKPANVLIDDRGTARLCDFGLVRLYDWQGPQGMTTTSPYTGTERYTAPELFMTEDNRSPAATFEGDIYALGCVALELFTSRPPFDGIDIYHLRTEILRGRVPAKRPTSVIPKIQLEWWFWDILEDCWALDPEDRPSIQGVCQDLSYISTFLYGPVVVQDTGNCRPVAPTASTIPTGPAHSGNERPHLPPNTSQDLVENAPVYDAREVRTPPVDMEVDYNRARGSITDYRYDDDRYDDDMLPEETDDDDDERSEGRGWWTEVR